MYAVMFADIKGLNIPQFELWITKNYSLFKRYHNIYKTTKIVVIIERQLDQLMLQRSKLKYITFFCMWDSKTLINKALIINMMTEIFVSL